jgi:branched-subunit amino acid aminotransferase/4-amino-4-deoxychorismate lyase
MTRARAVAADVQVGLIETMRARGGRLPWLARHLARLRASVAALGAVEPPEDVLDLVCFAVGARDRSDRVVRLLLTDGRAEITTRDVTAAEEVSVVLATDVHESYPHKTTSREQFGRAFANARRTGVAASDALLLTAKGYVAEGTAWNLFWWDNGTLCTPGGDLGILPGIGRGRVMELTTVTEVRVPVTALRDRSLFLVNAVRGIVEIGAFEGRPVPRDVHTAELAAAFWPD